MSPGDLHWHEPLVRVEVGDGDGWGTARRDGRVVDDEGWDLQITYPGPPAREHGRSDGHHYALLVEPGARCSPPAPVRAGRQRRPARGGLRAVRLVRRERLPAENVGSKHCSTMSLIDVVSPETAGRAAAYGLLREFTRTPRKNSS